MNRKFFAAIFSLLLAPVFAAEAAHDRHGFQFDWNALWELLTLQHYNTRIVLLGTTLMGAAAGLVGTFLLLRKRALLSDAISHATLPGVALAFIVLFRLTGQGKEFSGLLLGAGLAGMLGMLAVGGIRRYSRLKDDAAMGIVLSVFFGLGIALLSLAARMEGAQAAGLNTFIYGKPAAMLRRDVYLIALMAAGVMALSVIFFKEFALLCFDQDCAAVQGWPVWALDFLMMLMAVLVTITGLPIIGLILMVAFLVIPPSAARCWTHDLRLMALLSALIGGASGLVGSGFSALLENMPTGAVIVLAAAAAFFFSALFGAQRGLLIQWLRGLRLNARVDLQNLLRTIYEIVEAGAGEAQLERALVTEEALFFQRSWSRRRLQFILHLARRKGWIVSTAADRVRLTALGALEARKVARNHRLWEMYLITHADVAPALVDRDAEKIEHVLDEELIDRLERLLKQAKLARKVPPSPHKLELAGDGSA